MAEGMTKHSWHVTTWDENMSAQKLLNISQSEPRLWGNVKSSKFSWFAFHNKLCIYFRWRAPGVGRWGSVQGFFFFLLRVTVAPFFARRNEHSTMNDQQSENHFLYPDLNHSWHFSCLRNILRRARALTRLRAPLCATLAHLKVWLQLNITNEDLRAALCQFTGRATNQLIYS